jgi:tetratricopeptide (TPR) repeat protein
MIGVGQGSNNNSILSAEDYLNRGVSKTYLSDHSGAIVDYSKAIEINPNFGLAYYNRGLSKRHLKDYNGAIVDYGKAIELKPKYVSAYVSRGASKAFLKDYNGAIADYSKAIELKPNGSLSYYNRGISKAFLKDYNGAIVDYGKAIELKPKYDSAYVNRGVSKIYLKDYNGAITDCTKAIEINSNYVLAYFNRGVSKYNLNDLEGACQDVIKAEELGYDVSKLINAVCVTPVEGVQESPNNPSFEIDLPEGYQIEQSDDLYNILTASKYSEGEVVGMIEIRYSDDWSFSTFTNEEFISEMIKTDKIKASSSMLFDNFRIHSKDKSYLKGVGNCFSSTYSGDYYENGLRITNLVVSFVRDAKLFTLIGSSPPEKFHSNQKEFLKAFDTFRL